MNYSFNKQLALSQKGKGIIKTQVSGIRYIITFILLICAFSLELHADDPGIAKVRLIQESDTSFIFEVDIPQAYLGTFKAPLLPDGFTITNPKREFQSGWVTLKSKIYNKSSVFHSDDIIVLPWDRNAVDITAQWLNGKTYKGFFTRSLNGIIVPMNQIMLVSKSTGEILKSNFKTGLKHWKFKLIHLLLIITLVLAIPNRKVFSFLLAFTLGQMTSMLLVELRIIGFEILFGELILLLLSLYVSYHIILKKELKSFAWILFFVAILHGISYGSELKTENLLLTQRIQSLFAFNMAIEFCNYVSAILLVIIIPFAQRFWSNKTFMPIVTGSLAVFLILTIFSENILLNKKQILDFQQAKNTIQLQTPTGGGASAANSVVRSKGLMTSPVMVFLSVEPYETRKEILITGEEAVHILGLNKRTTQTFKAENQEQIKRKLEQLIAGFDTTLINNNAVNAERVIANFVTLGKGGVSIKETAVDETVDEAIIGITLNYTTEDFPDSIQFNWHLFPKEGDIDLSLVDPHSTFAGVINPTKNTVKWESRIKGFKLPAIEPIEVKNDPIAIFSYVLWLILIVFLSYWWYYKRSELQKNYVRNIAYSILIIGFVLFPFARTVWGTSVLSNAKPSQEKGKIILNDLLGNVYRAFDRKQEDLVYDRLEMSVTQDQLTEIYLQNRQSMALENRGGARATVDEVIVTQLYSVTKEDKANYISDTEWTVRGSVNHFGHTHYRQNKYRALVSFVIENNYWKISNIEILDARRLY